MANLGKLTRIALISFVCALFGMALSTAVAQEFRITYPEPGGTVGGEVAMVEGTGAVPGAIIEVSVFTNRFYVQSGNVDINANGDWTFAPVYFSGQPPYDNHTVRARLIRDGQVVATTTVRDVKRR